MIFLEVLLEGQADVPVVREILQRRFGLQETRDFRLHPHRGKGRLPRHPQRRPDPRHRGLLDQLPAKLRGYSKLPRGYWVIVLVDADREDCRALKGALVETWRQLSKRPERVLFRIAVEETESWFLADPEAVRRAYPRSRIEKHARDQPDQVIGAWECLASVLRRKPETCSGGDKEQWAARIAPHLDLSDPRSPSLRAFLEGIEKIFLLESP